MTLFLFFRRWLPILSLASASVGVLHAQAGLLYGIPDGFTSNGNPNGPWTFRAGTTPLPLTPSWNGNGTLGCTVPALAPSNSAGNFAPAFFQADSCVLAAFSLPGYLINSTIVRTSDDSAVRASLLFTAPANPVAIIGVDASVWNPRFGSQPQDWVLLINGVQKASGVLGGSVGYNDRQTYYPNPAPGINPGDTVELVIFKDPSSSSGDFVAVRLLMGRTSTTTTSLAEIDTYHTTHVTREVNTFQVELKARMTGGAFLYDQTFNAPLTDSSVQAAIAAARSLLTNAGAVSFTGPTQLSSAPSTSSATETVEDGRTPRIYVGTTTFIGPLTISTGDRGICLTGDVPPASASTPFYPTVTGCTLPGTPNVLYTGGVNWDTLVSSFVTINQTATTTNTTLTKQVWELDGVPVGNPPAATPAPPSLILAFTGMAASGLYAFRRRLRRGVLQGSGRS